MVFCTDSKYVEELYVKKRDNETKEFKSFKINEAKNWIKSLLSMKSKIKMMKNDIKELQAQIGVSGVQYSDIPKNPNVSDDAILNLVIMLESQSEYFQDLIQQYNKELLESEYILQSLRCHELAYEVIKRHYFKKQSYVYIGMMLNFSDRYIKEICKKALLEIYDKLPYYKKTLLPKAI